MRSVFMVGIRRLLAHAFGPGDFLTQVDVGSNLTVLKAAWGSIRDMSWENMISGSLYS